LTAAHRNGRALLRAVPDWPVGAFLLFSLRDISWATRPFLETVKISYEDRSQDSFLDVEQLDICFSFRLQRRDSVSMCKASEEKLLVDLTSFDFLFHSVTVFMNKKACWLIEDRMRR
jgi:hypothetical protein